MALSGLGHNAGLAIQHLVVLNLLFDWLDTCLLLAEFFVDSLQLLLFVFDKIVALIKLTLQGIFLK